MGVSTRKYTPRVTKAMAQVTEISEQSAVALAKQIRWRIASLTPILTGRHSASWNLAVGTANPFVQPADFYDPLNAWNLGQVHVEGFQLGMDLVISNGGPVIVGLNEGTISDKMPAKFVENTLLAVLSGTL
jgi:hypothetical protein